jgi:hypothetical protein
MSTDRFRQGQKKAIEAGARFRAFIFMLSALAVFITFTGQTGPKEPDRKNTIPLDAAVSFARTCYLDTESLESGELPVIADLSILEMLNTHFRQTCRIQAPRHPGQISGLFHAEPSIKPANSNCCEAIRNGGKPNAATASPLPESDITFLPGNLILRL